MAVRYGFYNSINGDRKYDALDMSSIFDGIIEDGVFATIGSFLSVSPGTGMQVVVGSGKAWFDHTWTSNDAPLPLDIESPDVTLDRYDAVILETDGTEQVRANSIKILKGEASSNPQHPQMTNTDLIHQHPLAYIQVLHGSTSIDATQIEIVVGTRECPFVTGPLETVSIESLFARWEQEFDAWFEHLQTNLEGDVAANLQKQIDDNYRKTLEDATKERLSLGDDATPDDAFNYFVDIITMIQIDKALARITLKTVSGNPLVGIPVSGLTDELGKQAYSDENGLIKGYVSEGSQTLSISGYADIGDYSITEMFVKGNSYRYDWSLTVKNFARFTKSQKVKFSRNVSRLDVAAGGGGGSGTGSAGIGEDASFSGAGGGSGFVTKKESVTFTPDSENQVIVGAGGVASSDGTGKNGGDSSLLGVVGKGGGGGTYRDENDSKQVIKIGGIGGANGADGVRCSHDEKTPGKPGGNSSLTMYTSIDQEAPYGGGGASGLASNLYAEDVLPAKGGTPDGADGAIFTNGYPANLNNGNSAAANTGGGGSGSSAGGSESSNNSNSTKGGNGGSGLVCVRMHLAAS